MNSPRTTSSLLMSLVLVSSCATPPGTPSPEIQSTAPSDFVKPDILMVVVDDLGWADVGLYGEGLFFY